MLFCISSSIAYVINHAQQGVLYLQHINYNMGLIDSLLDKLVPHECVGCNQEGSLLCSACARLLRPAPIHEPGGNLLKLQSATLYDGIAKDLIWKLKSGGAQAAAAVMAHHMANLVAKDQDYLIVPVPTATSRVRQRGYDQAKLLARALARQTRQRYADCLARHGQAHQVGASRQARLSQIEGALRVKRRVQEARIVLVDDVTTTGATLESAALVLKQAGASHVEALTFAYKPKEI